jgi:hypothetical protein
MKLQNVIPVFLLTIAFAVGTPRAHALGLEQATVITFTASVDIPGQSLPAGTYVFVPNGTNTNTVQIFNSDRTHLIATEETIATDRAEPSGEVIVALAEQGSGQPDALVSWFDPGESTGRQLVYPSKVAHSLDKDKQVVFNGDTGQPMSPSEETGAGE